MNFDFKKIALDDGKGSQQSLRYRNILAEDGFGTCSNQMLRLIDLMRSRG